MWPNLQETTNLVTFTEEIVNGKLHFLCSVTIYLSRIIIKACAYNSKFVETSPFLTRTKFNVSPPTLLYPYSFVVRSLLSQLFTSNTQHINPQQHPAISFSNHCQVNFLSEFQCNVMRRGNTVCFLF